MLACRVQLSIWLVRKQNIYMHKEVGRWEEREAIEMLKRGRKEEKLQTRKEREWKRSEM